jgi:8-oxo-dGTP diphosphatase
VSPWLEVAVGVVIRADGQVLLGQRPTGKPYAGWWEFPGGKIEAGESVAQALARELNEELGLIVVASHPWLVREFVYPHARVRLHFRRIFGQWGDFSGEPRSRENQAFGWQALEGPRVSPLLPASEPVFAWLGLPSVMGRWRSPALVDRPPSGDVPDASSRLEAAAPLQVFEAPGLSSAELSAALDAARRRFAATGTRWLVSSRHPEALARSAGGLLLETADLRTARQRPDVALCAARCETAEDVALAAALGLDLVISPRCDPQTRLPLYLEDPSVSLRQAIGLGAHGLAQTAG